MTEDRFQYEFIMWFGQKYPEYNNHLFEVNNNPKNEIHGAHRKSMGMKKNVSDLILLQPKTGKMVGIELKAPGSNWPKQKIENQLNWGKELIKNSSFYIISSNMELLKEFTIAIIENNIFVANNLVTKSIQYIENQKGKTINF